nr:hypothetical protein [Tanacetum cinerariifolium]
MNSYTFMGLDNVEEGEEISSRKKSIKRAIAYIKTGRQASRVMRNSITRDHAGDNEHLATAFFPRPRSRGAPEISFVANGVTYPPRYYLIDGIYPELTPLVKMITQLAADDYNRILYKKRTEWDNNDYVYRGLILKEAKYMVGDASSKKFLVSNFTNYKMSDLRLVMEQYIKLLGILGRFIKHKMKMDEAIQVSCVIEKLSHSWKDFKHTLRYKKEELTLVELASHLRTEESLKTKRKPNLNYLKVWGCRAVVSLPDPKLKNFDARCIECIFFGYAEHSKAFRFYIIEPNDSVSINFIIESRDVIFDENRFSSVPRPSLRIPNGTEDIGRSVVHEEMDVKTAFLNDDLDEEVNLTKEFLSSMISMKDMGEADIIFGIRIKHESNIIAISQSHYIKKVLKKINYFNCTPVSTPMDTSEKLMPNNGQAHWQAIQRVLKYLKKTIDYRLTYTGYPSGLKGYTNARWSNTENNSSTSGWVFLLGGAHISIRCDSAATLGKAYSQMYNEKSRHLGVRHTMIRDLITNEVVSIEFVRSQQNLADYLTKTLAKHLVLKSAE